MTDTDPARMTPKYRRAAVMIDLGVGETFAMQGEQQLVDALEKLLTLGEGTGPGGVTLLQMVCVTQQPGTDAEVIGSYLRMEFPLTAHKPHRGDAVERWLEEMRDEWQIGSQGRAVASVMLDQYQMKADAGEIMRGAQNG